MYLSEYRDFVRSHPKYRNIIRLEYLPFERFEAYERWKPETVKALFIAEAPSWKVPLPYFYDIKGRSSLNIFIFDYLGITGKSNFEKLLQFKKHGFFLIDAVKCIYDKGKMKSLTQEVIEFSARRFLRDEVQKLLPRCIMLLGKTSLRALKCLEEYRKPLFNCNSIVELCGRSIDVHGIRIIFSVFPNRINMAYKDRIKQAFETLKAFRHIEA